MAHTSFDVFPGTVSVLDNQTVMAVQSLLESQAAAAVDSTSGASILESVINASLDEDDVFQCGKCKKQFSSLMVFVNHKREPCMPLSGGLTATSISGSATMTMDAASAHSMNVGCSSIPTTISFNPSGELEVPQSLHQSVSAAYTTVSSSSLPQVVLNEADLLSLTALDHQTLTIPVHSTSGAASYLTQLTQVATHPPLSAAQPVMVPIQSSSIGSCNMGNAAIFTMAAVKTMPLLAKALSNSRMECGVGDGLTMQLNGSMDSCSSRINVVESKEKSELCKHLQDEAPITYSIIAEMQPSAPGESAADVVLTASGDETVIHEIVPVTKSRKRGKTSGSKADAAAKKVNKLQCLYCDKGFAKNFDLQQHIRAHTGEKPFQCIVCGRAFAQKSNVKKHMQTHKVWPNGISNTLRAVNVRSGSASVGQDSDVGETSVELQPVALQELPETPFVDEVAVKEQNEKENSHTSASDENCKEPPVVVDSSYICQFCNQSFKTYCHLKTHLKEHKNEQVYKCILKNCGQVFQELDTFLEHTKAHETEMSYWCHVCSKLFRSLYDLGVHQYSHSMFPEHEPKPRETKFYHCTRCMNKYSTPAALERHMETTSHSFECQHCKKVFPSERYLRRHLPTHCSQSLHMCSVCLKGFKTEHYLRMHLLIHSGDKPFQCQQCQASFNRKDKLKRHMLIHETVKRYKCPFRAHSGCMKEFHRPDKLKAHVITHSGARPFKCRQCNRAFSRRAHLREHQQLHNETADCKFSCLTCGNGFLDEARLKEHACDLAPAPTAKRRRTPRATRSRRAGSRTSPRKTKARSAKSAPAALPQEEEGCESQKKLVILEVDMPGEGTDAANEPRSSQEMSSNQLCELRLSIALDDPLNSYEAQGDHQETADAADNHQRSTYADFGTLPGDLLLDNVSAQEPGSLCAMVVNGQNVLLTLSNVMDAAAPGGDMVSHLTEI